MTKELFVSSTPHETKVGLVEDDLLAEIYLERENEYTLAGSIYKGRVTRVLPGMQSAFVDIGLERDAFLYVSDFMELEDADEVDEIPTNRPVTALSIASREARLRPSVREQERPSLPTSAARPDEHASRTAQPEENRESLQRWREAARDAETGAAVAAADAAESACRNRSLPGRDFARSAAHRSSRNEAIAPNERTVRAKRTTDRPLAERSERSDYGPPPGYQPIILPGESISKYQRLAQTQPRAAIAARRSAAES